LCGRDLAQGDPAVVGGDPVMPEGLKSRLSQAGDGLFQKVLVLKAAARENHKLAVESGGDRDNTLGQGVMKFGRDEFNANSSFNFCEDQFDHGCPIKLKSIAVRRQREGVAGFGFRGRRRKFQIHGRLAFKGHPLPQSDNGGYGVEQAPRAGGLR